MTGSKGGPTAAQGGPSATRVRLADRPRHCHQVTAKRGPEANVVGRFGNLDGLGRKYRDSGALGRGIALTCWPTSSPMTYRK
jgi:hypothetical protein